MHMIGDTQVGSHASDIMIGADIGKGPVTLSKPIDEIPDRRASVFPAGILHTIGQHSDQTPRLRLVPDRLLQFGATETYGIIQRCHGLGFVAGVVEGLQAGHGLADDQAADAHTIKGDQGDEMVLIWKFLLTGLNGLHQLVESGNGLLFYGFHRAAFIENDQVMDGLGYRLCHDGYMLNGDEERIRFG